MISYILLSTGITLVVFIAIKLEALYRIFYEINERHETDERMNKNKIDDFRNICDYIDLCYDQRSLDDVNKMIDDFENAYRYRNDCGKMVGYMRQLQFARTKFIESKRTMGTLN